MADLRAPQLVRESLIAWAEGGLRLAQTTERLGVHRNTLLCRPAKIE
ncbi:helix-turn-helix domain-containing protein [Streptomyces sp. AS02]|nr:helix-turn-helix domain-containing protein [Streptomyces sp. AS02]MCL8017334.1 helix-turn-helix domain-containing protein [Streptomyces sp. AS02]